MAEKLLKKMTVEEFFKWQEGQELKYELVDGVPVLPVKAMTGASGRHDTVTVNTILSLGNRLKGKPCRPRTSDQSVLTFRGTRRPDVSVECGRADVKSAQVQDPRVVIEILSPSTTRYDRFQKLAEYQQHPAIQVILIVDTEQPRVTVWRRSGETWQAEELEGLDATIPLPEIDVSLPLAELYLDLTFDADQS